MFSQGVAPPTRAAVPALAAREPQAPREGVRRLKPSNCARGSTSSPILMVLAHSLNVISMPNPCRKVRAGRSLARGILGAAYAIQRDHAEGRSVAHQK
jgi:hypothetical protein